MQLCLLVKQCLSLEDQSPKTLSRCCVPQRNGGAEKTEGDNTSFFHSILFKCYVLFKLIEFCTTSLGSAFEIRR